MAKMKNSGIEWIGEIPEDWDVKKLKYIATSFKKGSGITKEQIIENGDTPCVRYGDIYSKYNYSFTECKVRTNKNIIENPKYFSYGDILFTCTGELIEEIGKSIVYLGSDECLAGGDIFIAKHFENPAFMGYALDSFYTQNQKSFGKAKLKVVHISTGEIENLFVCIPPLEIQKRIADFLNGKCIKIDGLKNDIQKQIETLEQYKKSVITEAVTKGLNPNAKMKDSGSKWMPLIPEHWNMDKLKYNLTVHEIKGYGDKEVLSLYRELGIVPKNSRDDNHNVTSEDTSKYKYVRKGDFVINKMKAWQGSVAVSDYEGIVSPAYYVYEFITENYDKRYFHHLMRNKILADEFRRISGGIREGQWDLDRDQFENMYLPVPPKSEQIAIADFIDSKYGNIEKSVELKKQQLEKLEEYKKSLIFEYVTGKKKC